MNDSLEHVAWWLGEINQKIDRIRALSDINFVGTNGQVLIEILQRSIDRLESGEDL